MSQDGGNVTEIRALEVDAYSSVHDMIHASIISHGPQATLREIYRACEARGRIAYKRSGGSRLITQNEHWKSQIRHALYTCNRFKRAGLGEDYWTIAEPFLDTKPATCKVIIRGDDDPRGPQTPGPTTVRSAPVRASAPSRRPPRPSAAARQAAGKREASPRIQHATRAARTASPEPALPSSSVKGRRSGSGRPASRFAGRLSPQLGASVVHDVEDAADVSMNLRASMLHSRSLSATGFAPQQGPYLPYSSETLSEGEDESSHTGAPAAAAGLPQRRSNYSLRGHPPFSPSPYASQSGSAGAAAAGTAPGQLPMLRAAAPAAPRLPDHLQHPPRQLSAAQAQLDVLTFNSTIRDKLAGELRRAGSAEAESPPNVQAYTARLRSGGPGAQCAAPASCGAAAGDCADGAPHGFRCDMHVPPPVSSRAATPSEQVAGSAVHTQSVPALRPTPSIDAASEGPIKKRFKAAAKAAAAADAAAQEVDSARADSAAATTTNTTVGGSLLQAAQGRAVSVDRAAGVADGAAMHLRSTAAAGLASAQGRKLGGGDLLQDCDSPCSASGQQHLAAMGDGPAAAALARRKGLRSRPPLLEGRRTQLMDDIEAAGAGGLTARAPPPMYHAGPVALSATDNGTNATATATPFAFSMSQAGTSSVAQPGWQVAGEQSRCACTAPSAAMPQAAAESEPRWQLRSQQAPP